MQEIKCPKCGEVFTVDESGYAAIVKQVHDAEFDKEINRREKEFKTEKENAISLAVTQSEAEKDKVIAELKSQIALLTSNQKQALDAKENEAKLALAKTEANKDKVIADLEAKLSSYDSAKAAEIERINSTNALTLAAKEQEIQRLSNQIEIDKVNAESAVERAVQEKEKKTLQIKKNNP